VGLRSVAINEIRRVPSSMRPVDRVLEYTDFRNFTAVIAKAREACSDTGPSRIGRCPVMR